MLLAVSRGHTGRPSLKKRKQWQNPRDHPLCPKPLVLRDHVMKAVTRKALHWGLGVSPRGSVPDKGAFRLLQPGEFWNKSREEYVGGLEIIVSTHRIVHRSLRALHRAGLRFTKEKFNKMKRRRNERMVSLPRALKLCSPDQWHQQRL